MTSLPVRRPRCPAETEPSKPGLAQLSASRKALFAALGGLLAFDNISPLYGLAGLTSASPAIYVLVVLAFVLPPSRSGPERVLNRWVAALAISAVLSVLLSFWLYSSRGIDPFAATIGGTAVPAKALKTAVIVALWIICVRVGIRLGRSLPESLFWIGVGLLTVNTLSAGIQAVGLSSSEASDFFHALAWHADRPRGFKFESSVLGASIVAAIALMATRMTLSKTLALCLGGFLILGAVTSRGALVSLGVGVVLGLWGIAVWRAGRSASRVLFCLGLTAIIAAWSLLGFFFATSEIWQPLASPGSDATRTGWGLAAVESLTHHPLGLNLVSYWIEINDILTTTYGTLTGSFQARDLYEFSSIIYSTTDSGLSPKSAPALSAVWFGPFGLVATIVLLVGSVARSSRVSAATGSGAAIGTAATVASLSTFVPGIFTYETALVLGAALGTALPTSATDPSKDQ